MHDRVYYVYPLGIIFLVQAKLFWVGASCCRYWVINANLWQYNESLVPSGLFLLLEQEGAVLVIQTGANWCGLLSAICDLNYELLALVMSALIGSSCAFNRHRQNF